MLLSYLTRRARMLTSVGAVIMLSFALIGSSTAQSAFGLSTTSLLATSDATSYAAPAGLSSDGQDQNSFKLAWAAVDGAPRYRLQLSSSPNMADAVYYRFTDPSAEIKGLMAGTTYYAKVRVISMDGANLSAYSAAFTVKTDPDPSAAMTVPTGLTAAPLGQGGIALIWDQVGGAAGYRVEISGSADMRGATEYRFSVANGDIDGLNPGTTYYVRVQVTDADGAAITDYSSPMSTNTAEPLPPVGLKSTGQGSDSVSLAWGGVAGTTEYRVMFASKPDLSDAGYWRFTPTSGTVSGLKPETVYYFRIRALKAGGASLTGYSPLITVKTGTAAPLPPTGLKVSLQTSTALVLTWDKAPNAPRYRVAISAHADMSAAKFLRFTDPSADIRGLTPGTTYYADVRIITADGANISAYSAPVKVATSPKPFLPPVTNPLSVATYNVHCANCADGMEAEAPWVDRRDAVVSNIVAKMPDIIGTQEASQGWLAESPTGGLSQFEDVLNRLHAAGTSYELTNDKRNNCENPDTPTACIPMDQGASQGTRIYFNSKTVKIVRSGSQILPALGDVHNDRYLAWAEVIQLSTGKHFFFGDTQLEADKADGYNDLRRQQAEAIVGAIKTENTSNLPILMVGDMNSSKWVTPSNAPYDVFTASGLIDPLGNTYESTLPSGLATAEQTTNTNVNSWNGFERQARAGAAGTNGIDIDYIFTSTMRVPTWETVANLDAAGNYVGIIPSDHNMIYATVELP